MSAWSSFYKAADMVQEATPSRLHPTQSIQVTSSRPTFKFHYYINLVIKFLTHEVWGHTCKLWKTLLLNRNFPLVTVHTDKTSEGQLVFPGVKVSARHREEHWPWIISVNWLLNSITDVTLLLGTGVTKSQLKAAQTQPFYLPSPLQEFLTHSKDF